MNDLRPLDPSPQYVLSRDKTTIQKVFWEVTKAAIEAGKFSGVLEDTEGNTATRVVTEPTPVYETLAEAESARNS